MMKRSIYKIIVFAICLGYNIEVYAHDFEVDGMYYNILNDSLQICEITHKGDFYNSFYDEYMGDISIPPLVTYNGKTYEVVAIGNSAFERCTLITSIQMPNTITRIGDDAFNSCTRLTAVTIPDGVATIGASAFQTCTSLETIIIPDNVVSIGNFAFGYCSALKSITIPGSITTMSSEIFYKCNELQSVYMQEGLQTIGAYSFQDCISLNTIEIPGSVTNIEEGAFYGCRSICSIDLPAISQIKKATFSYCTNLTSIDIPDSVTVIDDNAFSDCANLTSATMPPYLQYLGKYAFAYCTNLTTLNLNNEITTIKESAFYQCNNLETIVIPNSVKLIDYMAFYGCPLKVINSEAEVPPVIRSNTFRDYTATLYVPYNSIDLYKEKRYWENFSVITTAHLSLSTTNDIAIKIVDKRVYVEGVSPSTIFNIYSMGGTRLYSATADKVSEITLSNGIYCIQTGGFVQKVAIQ